MTSGSNGKRFRIKSKRRSLLFLAGITLAVVIGWFVYTTVNILSPAQGQLQAHSDVVVSLAPQTHRLPLAQQLISDGVAETLVISYFDHDPLNYSSEASTGGMSLQAFCESDAPHEIVCFTAEENATIGEAYAIAGLIKEESWNSLTVVTDTTHAFRTRFIFEQCLGDDLDVNVVVADRDLAVSERLRYVMYENAAFFKAVWQTASRC